MNFSKIWNVPEELGHRLNAVIAVIARVTWGLKIKSIFSPHCPGQLGLSNCKKTLWNEKKIPIICRISKMGVADSSGQNLDWEAIRISFQFKIDTSMYMQNFKIKKKIILISFRNFFLQSQFHTYELIVLQNVCGYFSPSFSDLFYAAFRLQPAPIWSALGFLHFQVKLNNMYFKLEIPNSKT